MSNFVGSADQLSFQESKSLVIKGVRLSNSYLGLDNENVYSSDCFC